MKRNRSGPRLWTKDFSCITIATVLSAIGGEAMNLPISLLVFDETKSTLLSALILVCGMLPDMILPILVAPLIDKGGKKKWIVGLDVLLAAIYGLMGVWILGHTFSYGLYVGFTLTLGTISVFYRLAFSAWYPDLIPAGGRAEGLLRQLHHLPPGDHPHGPGSHLSVQPHTHGRPVSGGIRASR